MPKKPNPQWAGLGWNPIQTGDCHMHPSQVVGHRNDGRELYVKCIPMQWPLDNVPGDCVFETWTTLEGPVIHMRFRCTNQRADQTTYRPCAQELPAVYTISQLSRLMAYTGDQPFTAAALTHVGNDWHAPWPWTRFTATERWAALVDTNNWGLGVFKDDGGEFHGGIYGDGRSADLKHASTAYVAPIHRENFDHNIVYEHRTDFMVGPLDAIRHRFNAMATKAPPAWRFAVDRQHWTLTGATDQGLPLPVPGTSGSATKNPDSKVPRNAGERSTRRPWPWRSRTLDRPPRPASFGSDWGTADTMPNAASTSTWFRRIKSAATISLWPHRRNIAG
ncbi:MAG: hypothetical protein V9H26_05025 [Verrucomicrobiota bacterium]